MKLALVSLILIFSSAAMQPACAARHVRLDQQFDIKVGKKVELENGALKIDFQAVSEDSRCPEDVTCVWQGNAKVVLRLSKAGVPDQTISLNTGLDPKHIEYQGYDIKLVDLNPHRKRNVGLKKGDYVATLMVTRK